MSSLRSAHRSFLAFFALYALVSMLLLATGLVAALALWSPAVRDALARLATSGGPLAAIAAGLLEASRDTPAVGVVAADYLASALAFGLGVFLVLLRPHHPAARLLGLGMVGTAAAFNLQSHAVFVAMPYSPLNAAHFAYHAFSGAAYLHGLLLFPDGRSVREWPLRFAAFAYAFGALVAAVFLDLVTAGGARTDPFVQLVNPTGKHPELHRILAQDALFFVVFFGLLTPAVGLLAQRQRYAQATTDVERQQALLLVRSLLLCFGAATIFLLPAIPLIVAGAAVATELQALVFRVMPLIFSVIPISLFVGLLRYRLWDVNRILNRALVYAAVTGILGGLTLAMALVLGAVIGAVLGQENNYLVTIPATMLVMALFRPLRERVQAFVDYRFDRLHYDAAAAVAELGVRLTKEVEIRSIEDDLFAVLGRTLQPRSASLWLSGPGPRPTSAGSAEGKDGEAAERRHDLNGATESVVLPARAVPRP